LQGALPDAEILLDRGQGDVHDRNIEYDHELRRARQYEDDSFAGVCLGCHDGLLSDLDGCALHLQLPDTPYLDGSGPRAGYLRSDFDRFVEVLAIDQAVAADLLLGFSANRPSEIRTLPSRT